MMHIQSRKRKWVSPFSSFLLFSPHFPLNLNCQTNWKGKKPNHSEDPNSRASSSSTTPPGGDYEVFLSFRGKDTRKSFTDYLYTSLVDVGIHVFRDDNELRVGEEIGPELLRNITQSKISIPIISDDYASSKWCLRELAHMLKCKRNKGQIVLPIFYKVDPSQVRHLIGRWEDAINAHKKNLDKMIVQEWEEALKEVGSLKGWESDKVENGHEGALIKIVVRKVMSKLRTTFQVTDLEQFVGIDDRVEKIMSLIDPKFNDTRIIGIYGMGGIGKTTLARVLYHNLSSHFDHLSFVANVRETSLRKGIEHLQKQLIKDILRNPYDVSNVFEGINFIKSRFTSKKVLLLLDDMDDNAHLNALAGDSSWFKAGSIVIITTRNKAILDKARAGSMHQLNELPSDQSLILFSRHAFRKDFPSSDYEHISRAIVSTTGGLPLALEVIGSLLREKTMKVWEETLKKLRSVPVQKVQETLKISYEALDDGEKQIFLDIACFFIGESQESPIYMWDACGFFPGTGIEVLSDMSLIKIDGDGTFMMHDQLRDLGREIVRLENPMEPQQRSRLWIEEEAKLVLDGNKGTSKIQALRLHLNGWREICTAETFKELTNLRFLQLKGVNLTGDFQNLFPQLRWLDWTDYHLDLESTNFHPKKLVVLNLSRSKTSEDWGGWSPQKMAMELKVLNLMKCKKLAQLPNSIGSLKSLQQLLLSKCYSLRQIPDSIRKLTSLTELHLQSTAIEELPKSIGSLKKLKTLNASYCASLTHIPNSIGDLASLSCLDLTKCEKLAQFPESIGSLMSLQQLLLSECHSLRKIPDSIGKLTLLSKLYLQSTAIKELPESIGSLKELKTLDASFCALLARIPNSIGNLVSLSHLDLTACQKLAQLPESIGSLMSLQQLLLLGCRSLRQIPDSIGKLISLTKLDLRFSAIEELPESIGSLKELKTLNASFCTSLARIPNSTVLLKHCKIPPANNSTMYYQRTVSEDVLKRSRPFGISDEDSESMADVKPRIDDDSADKSRIWKLTEINEPSQCNSIRLPDTLTATRVSRLIYLNSGRAILALSSNAVPKHWKWQGSRASSSVVPRLCRPPDWNWMSNDTSDANPEDAVPCFALSKNESYIISASGGKIYLFNMITCKMTTFMHPPAAATFLAFHPQDNNIIAIGMEDCSIQIYNVQVDEVKTTLRGHQKRITGLAFSNVSNVLVSSGADSQLCVWSTDGWEKQASKVLQMPSGRGASPLADTHVQFHLDQTHLLVVHKTQIAIYEAPKLRCLKQWVTREASSPITHATYSCDGQSIYVSFEDGSIGVLTTSTLIFRCRINPAAYIPPNPSLRVYPLVIAAHPFEPNQFALGLTDGCVYVLKPLEFEGKWGISPVENGAGPSTTSGATASEQPQR